MHHKALRCISRYGSAVLLVVIGTVSTWAVMALIAMPLFAFYIWPIAKATCAGGLGPGVIAAILALFMSNYFFLPPYFSLASDASLLPLIGCYLGTVVLSALYVSKRHSTPHRE